MNQQKHIPEEIGLEILSWLPAKSLMRFKAVCKLWNNQTSDSQFIKCHRLRSNARPAKPELLVCVANIQTSSSFREQRETTFLSANREGRNLETRYTYSSKYHPVSEVVDGLVCFMDPRTTTVTLCNLSTHECLNLPDSNFKRFGKYFNFRLIGVDRANMIYKVVHVCRLPILKNSDPVLRCEVFTLGTKSWRIVNRGPRLYCPHQSSVSVNGVMYYLSSVDSMSTTPKLIAFHLSDEEFRMINLPDGISKYSCRLTQIDQRLALLSFSICCRYMKLWKLEENQIWVQESQVLVPCQWPKFVGTNISSGEILILNKNISSFFYYDRARRTFNAVELPEEALEFIWSRVGDENLDIIRIYSYMENIMQLGN